VPRARSQSPAAQGDAEEELGSTLQALVAFLREALTPAQRAQFLALCERDLGAVTAALNTELSRTPRPATKAELVARVLRAMSFLSE
jgi:hypothetical protein